MTKSEREDMGLDIEPGTEVIRVRVKATKTIAPEILIGRIQAQTEQIIKRFDTGRNANLDMLVTDHDIAVRIDALCEELKSAINELRYSASLAVAK